MSGADRFGLLIARSGAVLPRGVLGDEARAFARAVADGASAEELAELRARTAAAHWGQLRLALGAALERHVGETPDATAREALELTLDERPGNPFALAVADEAGRSLAGVLERNAERLTVLQARLAAGAAPDDDLALVIGAMVVDLLDFDPEDFEQEITAYVGAGETDAARAELARATGDLDAREWAREELRRIDAAEAPVASRALRAISAGEPPEDPAVDAVWVAAILALVEQAVEYAVVSQNEGDD
jgi:hypothetical protein